MATFAFLENQIGLASQSLALSASVTFNLDLRTMLGATLELRNTGGGTVQAGAAVNIFAYTSSDGTTYSTTSITSPALPTVVNTLQSLSVFLDGGRRYQIKLTNTDSANATVVAAVYSEITGIA